MGNIISRCVLLGLIAIGSYTFSQKLNHTWQEEVELADSLKSTGEIQQALAHYFAALRRAEGEKQPWAIAVTSERLGDLHEKYYRYRESIPYLKRAYGILKELDSISFLARVTNTLAWNYIKVELPDSALRYAEEAVHQYKKWQTHDVLNYCIALESLGEIYSKLNRYSDADRTLNLCMQLGQQANNPVIVGFTNYGIALNEFNQRKLIPAQQHIELCVPVAEKYATPELLADVYKLAYDISNANAHQSKAFHFLKKYSELKEKLHSEDIEKKAAIVNANYEIQKKEADLRISNQLNAIQLLEIQQQRILRNIFIALVIVVVVIAFLIYSRIQGKRKFEQQELGRKKEEMEQARKVQLSLLPKNPLDNDSFLVAGKMITATEVGGDYYDYFKLDENRVLIAFGDATGHGMAAGMLVTITKVAIINNLGLLKDNNNVVPLARVINESILASISVKGIGMSMQLVLIDRNAQKIFLTSCGMPYPMLLNIKSRAFSMLEIKQPPLGFFKSTKVELTELDFNQNICLILVSDGILERFNQAREEYGIERLSKVLCQSNPETFHSSIIDSIYSDAERFAEGLPHQDDMSVLIASIK